MFPNKNDLEQLKGVWRGGFRLTTFASIFTFAVALVLCFTVPLESFFPGIHPRLVQAAIIFALCNRAPGEWSNKHIQELTGKIETETKPGITLANVPDNLLAQVIDAINGK